MTTLPLTVSKPPRALGPVLVFGLVYLAALAVIFAPEGSLSSRAGSDFVTSSR